MEYYIGLDAHAQTCTAVVADKNGEQKLRQTFNTTEANLIDFLSKISGVKHFTFEDNSIQARLTEILFES